MLIIGVEVLSTLADLAQILRLTDAIDLNQMGRGWKLAASLEECVLRDRHEFDQVLSSRLRPAHPSLLSLLVRKRLQREVLFFLLSMVYDCLAFAFF